MSHPILVTGSEGLVGGARSESLEARGHSIVGLVVGGDAAVAAAYGWDAGISEDDALRKLLDLNQKV